MKQQQSQRQLLELAAKHKTNPTVSCLLASIGEARVHARAKSCQISDRLSVLQLAMQLDNDEYSVPLYNTDVVSAAHDLSSALTRISHDFMTLASVLQHLGEEITY